MANKYVLEVQSDWSQPERAVRQYADAARKALQSISTARADPGQAGLRKPASRGETIGRYERLGGQISRQQAQAELALAREQAKKGGGDQTKVRALNKAIEQMALDLKAASASIRSLAKGTGKQQPIAGALANFEDTIRRARAEFEPQLHSARQAAAAARRSAAAMGTKAKADEAAAKESQKRVPQGRRSPDQRSSLYTQRGVDLGAALEAQKAARNQHIKAGNIGIATQLDAQIVETKAKIARIGAIADRLARALGQGALPANFKTGLATGAEGVRAAMAAQAQAHRDAAAEIKRGAATARRKNAAEAMASDRAVIARSAAQPGSRMDLARRDAEAAKRESRGRTFDEGSEERIRRDLARKDERRRVRLGEQANLLTPGSAAAIAQREIENRNREIAAAKKRERLAAEKAALATEGSSRSIFNIWQTEKQIEAERKRQLSAGIQAAERSGQLPRGTLYQRVMAARANAAGTPTRETDVAGLRESVTGGLGNRFRSSAQFALSGAVLYGGQKFLRETITEASELQSSLALLQGQLESSGQSGEDAFTRVKDSIIDTSKETGIMATQIVQIERQLMGIFRSATPSGNDTGPDLSSVEEATRISAQFSQVTGVDVKTITDEFVAIYKSFEGSINEISFAKLADELVTISLNAGVTQAELLEMSSSLAPLTRSLGFTTKELLGFSAAAISSSGKGASTLAENFGRVLTDLSSKSQDIIQFYADVPALAEKVPQLSEMFASGDIQGVMRSFIEDWSSLSATAQQSFAEKIFGRREAQSVVSILNQGQRTLELMETPDSDSGAFEKMLEKRRKTVQYQIDRMERTFEEFGDALYNAGLDDAIKVFFGFLSGMGTAATSIIRLFNDLNDTLGDLPKKILVAAAAWKVLAFAQTQVTKSAVGGVLASHFRAGPGGRFNPWMGAAPVVPLRGQLGSIGGRAPVIQPGTYTPGVTSALQRGGVIGSLTQRSLMTAANGGRFATTGRIGATALGGLSSFGPAAAAMTGFVALGALKQKEEEWVEEIKTIAQEEEQLILEGLKEGKTEGEIRAELGTRTDLPKSNWGRLGANLNFSGAARSVGSVAQLAPGLIKNLAFGKGEDGNFWEEFQNRNDDINLTEAERLEEMRDAVFANAKRDERAPIVELFDDNASNEKALREEILKNLSGDLSQEELRQAIQNYMDDPTNERFAADMEQILGAAAMNDVVGPLVEAEQEKIDARERVEEALAGVTGDKSQLEVEQLRRQVETGQGGRENLIDALRADAASFRRQIADAQRYGNKDQIRQILPLLSAVEDEIATLIRGMFDTPAHDAILELMTGGDPTAAITAGQEKLAELQGIQAEQERAQGNVGSARANLEQVKRQIADANRGGYAAAGTGTAVANTDAVAEAQAGLDEAVNAADPVALEDSIQAQFEVVQDIIGSKQEELRNLIDATENIQEKERLRQQGITLTEGEMAPLLYVQLVEGENPERIQQIADRLGIERAEVWEMIRKSLIEGDETVREGLELAVIMAQADLDGVMRMIDQASRQGGSGGGVWEKLTAMREAAKAALDAAKGTLEDFDAITSDVVLPEGGNIAGTGESQAERDNEAANKAREDAREQARQAIERRKIFARHDPVAMAKLQKESALLDLQIARQLGDKAQEAQALTAVMAADAAIADAIRESSRAQIQGQAAIASARAAGDPLAAARASQWEANALRGLAVGDEVNGAIAAQIDAANRVTEAMQDIQRAQMEYAQAQAFGDPVKQANAALQIANYNVATAQGEAERLRALIAQMDAQRALQQAIIDVFNAWNSVAQAQREAAGDTIGAAQLELERIKKNLDSARRQGDNMKVLELTADAIRAEAAVRDATLQDRQSDIDFALQMQEITTAQAIAQLELLLQIPNLTKQQIQELQLKIKSLKDDLGRDFQFNLPTELGLPTLYEVRRMNQSGGNYQEGRNAAGPAQVQDNRTYDISIVASGVDAKEALKVVTDAISAPATTGTRGLGY